VAHGQALQRPESCRNRAGHAGLDRAGQRKIGMIECIEQLAIDAQLDSSRIGKAFVMYISEYVKCGPRTALRPELPNWQIAGLSFSTPERRYNMRRSWDRPRDERIGVEPLPGSVDGDAGIGSLEIERHAGTRLA